MGQRLLQHETVQGYDRIGHDKDHGTYYIKELLRTFLQHAGRACAQKSAYIQDSCGKECAAAHRRKHLVSYKAQVGDYDCEGHGLECEGCARRPGLQIDIEAERAGVEYLCDHEKPDLADEGYIREASYLHFAGCVSEH